MKALVMGLGINGGGLASALFLVKRSYEIVVTDLRGEDVLRPSIETLDAAARDAGARPVRYVLGRHDIDDFHDADLVIKNPGVRPDSPYLKAAKHIETDISLFLRENPARLFAVTGSKGKSGTASALHFILQAREKNNGRAFLGGNITVSPLTFLSELTREDDVVLELSGWQLGDLPAGLLKPRAAIITEIMSDHLDRYGTMENYIADKKLIYANQDEGDVTVIHNCSWADVFSRETRARVIRYGDDILSGEDATSLLPKTLLCPGKHQRVNFLGAAFAACDVGTPKEIIRGALSEFPGIEHRLEFFFEKDGTRYYNDSAATVPEAAAFAVEALSEAARSGGGVILVAGGTDKMLDFTPVLKAARKTKKIILLSGSAGEKLAALFREDNIMFEGPFDNLDAVIARVREAARPGDYAVLSPGCTSFGMFLNEFDRGKKWKEAVRSGV